MRRQRAPAASHAAPCCYANRTRRRGIALWDRTTSRRTTGRSDLLGTFGAFLAAAAESWQILTETASEWMNALVLAGKSERS